MEFLIKKYCKCIISYDFLNGIFFSPSDFIKTLVYNPYNIHNMCQSTVYFISKASGQQEAISGEIWGSQISTVRGGGQCP